MLLAACFLTVRFLFFVCKPEIKKRQNCAIEQVDPSSPAAQVVASDC